jgi:hypothetical protein
MPDGIHHRPDSGPTLADLAAHPRWVAWRTEPRREGENPTKVPYSPRGHRAASNNPAEWGTRAEAEAAFHRIGPRAHGPGGIGLMLGEADDGFALGGVDLDACRDPTTGSLAPWAEEVRARFGTYAEASPSGGGAKLFFAFDPVALPELRAAMGAAPGEEKNGRKWAWRGGDHAPAIELYLGGRFFAVTGERLADSPAGLRAVPSGALLWLIREAGPRFKESDPADTRGARAGAAHGVGPDDAGDDALLDRLHRAAALTPVLAQRWAGDTTGLADGTRSGLAFALGAALKRAGFSYADMRALLRLNPRTAAWTEEKGGANGERELRRIWERAAEEERAAAPWPAPDLALATADTLPPPDWPRDLFPAPWPEWIEAAAEGAGAPPDYVGCALLCAAGAQIGNARWGAPWGSWREPPVLNVAVVGNPSAGKSPGLDTTADRLSDLEAEMNADWEERQREWRTRRQAAKERRAMWEADVKEAVKRGNPPPAEPPGAGEPEPLARRRALSTDPTTEKAARLSAENPRGLLLLRDELAGWIANMDRYSGAGAGGGDRAFWLQAYGGRRWVPDRVKDGELGVAVPHLAWGVLGGIQPDRVASLLMAGDDDGLAARFLYTWPAPRPPRRPQRAPRSDFLLAMLRRLRELPWQPPEPVVLPFTEEAAAALQDWREEAAAMEAEAAGLFLSWLGKLPGFTVRLAVVFEHLAWLEREYAPPPEAVGMDAVARALGFLADYAVPMARRVFGEAALPEAERDARRLGRWYLRQPAPWPETLNARALRRAANGPGIPTASRITAALEELAELGWVRAAPAREGSAGRQRADWTVNPALREERR